MFLPTFLSYSIASFVLYNRTEHSEGFSFFWLNVCAHLSTNAFHSTNLFVFSRCHVPINHVAPFSSFKSTHNPQFFYSLRRRVNARKGSFYSRNGDQFTISTLLIYSTCFVTPTDPAPNSFFRNYQPLFTCDINRLAFARSNLEHSSFLQMFFFSSF